MHNYLDSGPPCRTPLGWGLSTGLGVPLFAAHRFTASADALAQARRFIRQTLVHWGVLGCIEDVALVATELVANALCHALSPTAPGRGGWLGLARAGSTLLCSVQDSCSKAPSPRPHSPLSESGYGLSIVDALSNAWGYKIMEDGRGKTVWAYIPSGTPGNRG